MHHQHRIVIVGGGFAGLYAARRLGKAAASVTLIDRNNFHLFQPLLYQVATGSLSPGDIASPLRAVLKKQQNTTVLMGEVTAMDVAGKRVVMNDGSTVPYDTLILATGSQNHYFGNNQWAEHAPGLKSVEEAIEIRQRVFLAFEEAERETDAARRRAWLTFVVVGAGPTGVELAGALGEIANDTLKGNFRRIQPEEARIVLVDGSERVLGTFTEELSRKAEADLRKVGVNFHPATRVVKIGEDGVSVKGAGGQGEEQFIPARTVLWAAGVTASPLGKKLSEALGVESDRGGRVKVNRDCTVPGHPEIFVVGDLAHHVEQGDKPLPGLAPVAMQQGAYVAGVIRERLANPSHQPQPFEYWDKGTMAVIGRGAAVAMMWKLRFHGFLAWAAWLFVHLMYVVEFENRLLVFSQWAFQYFTRNRGSRLITQHGHKLTGEPPPTEQQSAAQGQARPEPAKV